MSKTELAATIMRHLRNWRDQRRTTYYVCDKCRKTSTDMHDIKRLDYLYRLVDESDDERDVGHECIESPAKKARKKK